MDIILVNQNNPLPKDFKPENLVSLKDIPNHVYILRDDTLTLNKEAAYALNDLLSEAKKAGFSNLKINSAYRTKEYQKTLQNMIEEDLVAKPGFSEHETGLAVDISAEEIILTDPDKEYEDNGSKNILATNWLAENCYKFGYILRYPKNKEKLTGIHYEPWHFRYVGKETAQYIAEHDLCLEEYFNEKYNVPLVEYKISDERETIEKLIWDYLLEKIENPYGVAGILGNLYAESGIKPSVLQYTYHKSLGYNSREYTEAVDSGEYKNFVNDCAGYGLAQWTLNVRKEGLLSYAKSQNKSIADPKMQIEYLWKELCNDYPEVHSTLLNARSVKEASDVVLTKFENPYDQSEGTKALRTNYCKHYYYKFINEELFEKQLRRLTLWRNDISFMVMNFDTGDIIYERDIDHVRPIGSIAKIFTAYLLARKIFPKIENKFPDSEKSDNSAGEASDISAGESRIQEIVTIDEECSKLSKNKKYSGRELMKEGDEYSVDLLLKMSLTVSACASTIALVKHFYGSEEAFIEELNNLSKELNLTSHFVDVIGMLEGTRASARDLVTLSKRLLTEYPQILHYTSQKTVLFKGIEYHHTSPLLINEVVKGIDGLKTGTTYQAGNCYLATAQRNNHRVISVVLNAQENNERLQSTEELLEYGLAKVGN